MLKASLLSSVLCAMLLVVTLPSVIYALPFMPDALSASSVAARFIETGTDTACVNCEDSDSTNDLTLTLGTFVAQGINGFAPAHGFMTMTGFLESIRDVDLTTFEFDLRVVTQLLFAPPEETAEYPLPSVTYGTVQGFIVGGYPEVTGGYDLNFDCCAGLVGSAIFSDVHATNPTTLDWIRTGESTAFLAFHAEAHWGGMPYTPEVTAVPEPTTLLLLGSGLIVSRIRWRPKEQMTARHRLLTGA